MLLKSMLSRFISINESTVLKPTNRLLPTIDYIKVFIFFSQKNIILEEKNNGSFLDKAINQDFTAKQHNSMPSTISLHKQSAVLQFSSTYYFYD